MKRQQLVAILMLAAVALLIASCGTSAVQQLGAAAQPTGSEMETGTPPGAAQTIGPAFATAVKDLGQTAAPQIETAAAEQQTLIPHVQTLVPRLQTAEPTLAPTIEAAVNAWAQTSVPRLQTAVPQMRTAVPQLQTAVPQVQTCVPRQGGPLPATP